MTTEATAWEPGDDGVLHLAAGTYDGPFLISRSIRVVADGHVVLRGAGEGSILRVGGRGLQITLVGLRFEGGGPARAGGAVTMPNGGRLVVQSCEFVNCAAAAIGGGAIAARRAEVVAIGCRFADCSAPAGGAVHIEGGEAKLTSCTFATCSASYAGAAVAARSHGAVVLDRCDLSRCLRPDVTTEGLGWLIDVDPPSLQPLSSARGCRLPAGSGLFRGLT